MKGREFPIVAVIIFLVLGLSLVRWVFGSWDRTPGIAPVEVTTDGSNISVSRKDLEDKRPLEERKAEVTKGVVKEFKRNEQIRDAAQKSDYVTQQGKLEGNREASKELDKILGKDPKLEEEIATAALIASIRAEKLRKEMEEKRAVREEQKSYNVALGAFEATVLRDDQRESRFLSALQALRQEAARVGAMSQVSEVQGAALQQRKAAVVEELQAILQRLASPDFKALVETTARRKRFGGAELRAEVSGSWDAYKDACGDDMVGCWRAFMRDEEKGLKTERIFARILEAFREQRYHDAVEMVEAVGNYVQERPQPAPPPPGAGAKVRLDTFCAGIRKRGYLAVEQSRFRHGELGPVRRYEANDWHAPAERHCVWAWRVEGRNGWSLQCSNWPFEYNFRSGDVVNESEAAPSGEMVRDRAPRMNPTLPVAVTGEILRGCAEALEELKAKHGVTLPEWTGVPGLQGIVNRRR